MKRVIALAIMAVGALVFLAAIGALPHRVGYYVDTYWPLLLIGWGLEGAWNRLRGRRSGVLWPVLALAAGVFFQMRNLHLFLGAGTISPWGVALGVLLIYIGFAAAGGSRWKRRPSVSFEVDWGQRRGGRRQRREQGWRDGQGREAGDPSVDDESGDPGGGWYTGQQAGRRADWRRKGCGGWSSFGAGNAINNRRLAGEVRYGDRAWHLHPLDIGMLAGEVRLNLATATIPTGETPIDIHLLAGEVRVQVPEDLAVQVDVRVPVGEWSVFEQNESGVGMPGYQYLDAGYGSAAQKVRLQIHVKAGEVVVARVSGDKTADFDGGADSANDAGGVDGAFSGADPSDPTHAG